MLVKVKWLYVVFLVLSFQFLTAQEIEVSGIVTDENGVPLPEVNITVENSSRGTTTDFDGNFEIKASEGEIINFASVGFEDRTVEVDGSDINVEMIQGTALDEVVVVGYGSQKKTTLTGSVSTVDMAETVKTPVTNFTDALAGRVPGVKISSPSGEPGKGDSEILIRGNHTINHNSPLIVIDGVPDRGGNLGSLNSQDIDDISVLKDASASIYGSQAANGVILVTTKKGRKNQKPTFDFSLNQGFNQPTRTPKMADAPTYMAMLNESAIYQGAENLPYSEDEIAAYEDPNRDPWLFPNTNWYKETLKTLSPQSEANLSVRGGGDNSTYFISLGALQNTGYYKSSANKYKQFNVRTNLSAEITKDIEISLNLSARQRNRDYPTTSAGEIFRMIIRGRPVDHARFPNGQPGPAQEGGNNPIVTATTDPGTHNTVENYFTGDLSIDVSVPGVDGLDVKGMFSYNKQYSHIKEWKTPYHLYDFDSHEYENNERQEPEKFIHQVDEGSEDASLKENFAQQFKMLGNLVVDYDLTIDNSHDFSLLLGTEIQEFKQNDFEAFRRHFISDEVQELFAGGKEDWTNTGSAGKGARLSYFGRFNYDYEGKYLLELVGRYDGSYLFPSNSRYGFFPSISVGWFISDETFFKDNINVIDDLKIRAGWGKTGNDATSNSLIEDQQYRSGYKFSGDYVFGFDEINQTIELSRLANPNVTWESAYKKNIGIEGTIFENLSFLFEYWDEKREDILVARNISIPKTAGMTLPNENIGKVRSNGFDISFEWSQNLSKDFSYQVGLNAAHSTSKILFWDESPGKPDYQVSTGKKINTALYYNVIGVFQNEEELEEKPHWPGAKPGDLIFEDVNGDGKINGDDRIRPNYNTTPEWTGGLFVNLDWKQWDLAVLFEGAVGAKRFIGLESGEIGNYFSSFAEDRWIPDPADKSGKTPLEDGIPYSGPRTFNRGDLYWAPEQERNTHFLKSTDYLRLKSVNIGYDFSKLFAGSSLESLRLYVSGYNLLTWDKLKVLDPEASHQSGNFYPQQRIYNVGVNVVF